MVGIDGWMVLLWLVEKGEHNRILYDVLPPDQHIIQITNQYTFMDIQRVYLHSEKLLMMGVWGKLSYSYVPNRISNIFWFYILIESGDWSCHGYYQYENIYLNEHIIYH